MTYRHVTRLSRRRRLPGAGRLPHKTTGERGVQCHCATLTNTDTPAVCAIRDQ